MARHLEKMARHLEKTALVVRQWERRLQGIERALNTWTSPRPVGEELLKDLEFSHHQPLSSRVFCFPGGSPGQRHIVQPHFSKELGLSRNSHPSHQRVRRPYMRHPGSLKW